MLTRSIILLMVLAIAQGCMGEAPTAALLPSGGTEVATASVKPATGPPVEPVKKDASCKDRFAEDACKQRSGCTWINQYKRMDGTWASAYCWDGKTPKVSVRVKP